jgi:phospholipid/cholesterol/gamma-HCH transport system ATP-binding protein
VISFQRLSKSFGPRKILDDVSFEVKRGEVLFVIGASGVGKSVLIKQVVGFIRPDSGDIYVDGEEVTRLGERELARVRKKCAMVFQHATLFDAMTCVENVALPLSKHERLSQPAALSRARELLARVHVEAFAERYPGELGDGLKKRVAIARALALRPEVVLFDEPTTGLDPVNARRVDRLIVELSARANVTCVVVSHDLTSIFAIADRIVMLYKGKVRLSGTRDDFRASDDAVVRQFVRGEARGPFET